MVLCKINVLKKKNPQNKPKHLKRSIMDLISIIYYQVTWLPVLKGPSARAMCIQIYNYRRVLLLIYWGRFCLFG